MYKVMAGPNGMYPDGYNIDQINVVKSGPKQVSSNYGSALGRSLVGNLVQSGFNMLNGAMSDYWNQRAEERAFSRTRQWTRQQYKDMVDGRRAAGLNPYDIDGSDAPSLTGASSTETHHNGNVNSDAIANQQLQLQNELVESQVNLNIAQANKADAEATATGSQDWREWNYFTPKLKKLIEDAVGQEQANRYAKVVASIAEATEQDQISQVKYTTSEMRDALGTSKQVLSNLRKDGLIKSQVYRNEQQNYNLLVQQVAMDALRYSLGVKEYQYLTGYNYFTGEKVNDGLWSKNIENITANISLTNAESELKELDVDWYEAEHTLDYVLEIVEIADIVNDDIFNWKDLEHKKAVTDRLENYKKTESDKRDKNTTAFLFIKLLPFLLKMSK